MNTLSSGYPDPPFKSLVESVPMGVQTLDQARHSSLSHSPSHPVPMATLRRMPLDPFCSRGRLRPEIGSPTVHPVEGPGSMAGVGAGAISRCASGPSLWAEAVIEGLWLRCQGMPVEEDVGRERRRRCCRRWSDSSHLAAGSLHP